MIRLKKLGLVLCAVVILVLGVLAANQLTGCIDPDEALPHYHVQGSVNPS